MTVWLVGVQVHAWFRPSSPWGITLWVAFVLAFVYGVLLIFNTLRRAERLEGAAKDFEASAAELTELIADLKAAKAQASTEAG
jgi:cytochrome c-type biogenesis protein CcmH/NrfF